MIYIKLFLVFAKIGLFGFGGGMAMLPMIYQGVQGFGIMEAGEFSDLVGISQITPGPLAVNAATYVGYSVAGFGGAASATIGVALPSFILVTLACYFVSKFKDSTIVEGAFAGIRPVTVGLIASAVVFMGQATFVSFEIAPIAIFLAAIILVARFKVSPILVMIGMGIIGAFVCG